VREKYCWLVADKPSEQGDGSRPLRRSLSWTPLSRAPAAACRGRAAPHWTPRAPRWAAVVGCSRAWLSAYGRRLTGRIGQQLTAERRVRSGKRSFEQGRGGQLRFGGRGHHQRRTPDVGATHHRLRRREQGDALLCCIVVALWGRMHERQR
jgi:hypothetical protein